MTALLLAIALIVAGCVPREVWLRSLSYDTARFVPDYCTGFAIVATLAALAVALCVGVIQSIFIVRPSRAPASRALEPSAFAAHVLLKPPSPKGAR